MNFVKTGAQALAMESSHRLRRGVVMPAHSIRVDQGNTHDNGYSSNVPTMMLDASMMATTATPLLNASARLPLVMMETTTLPPSS